MKQPEVVSCSVVEINGQLLVVPRYAPTEADKLEGDHSRLSFRRNPKNRLNNKAVRGPQRPATTRRW